MSGYDDRNDPGNGISFLTGKPCIECGAPAGTYWGKYWCFDCNVRRINRIDKELRKIANDLEWWKEREK